MKLSTVVEWALTILLSIVAPIVVYSVATGHGIGEVPALLLSGVPPLIEMALTGFLRRRLDEFGTIVLVLVLLSVIVALVGGGPQLLLLRESTVTGLFGLVMLVTIPTRWPLIFLFGRRFATGGVPARVAWWNGLWQYAEFRRLQRQLTAMWGVTLVVEAVVRAVLAYQLPVPTMVLINNIAPTAIIAVLVTITILRGKRMQRRAEARMAAQADGSANPSDASDASDEDGSPAQTPV